MSRKARQTPLPPGTFAGDYSDNRGQYLIYDAPFGRFGSIICFDLDFTDSARNVARQGAGLLAVSSSDVPGIAEKHYDHLVFRLRRPVRRVPHPSPSTRVVDH